MSAILDFFRMWWDGKLPDGYTLGGVPVFWVERIGKGFQIGAGLVVVFDLLTSRWLTDWANRASIRATQRDMLARHLNRRKEIQRDLVREESRFVGKAVSTRYELQHSPPGRVPPGIQLTLDAYRGFHHRVIEQAKREHQCKKRHEWLCAKQREYLERRANELALGQLPPDEFAVVASADAMRTERLGIRGGISALIFLLGWFSACAFPVLWRNPGEEVKLYFFLVLAVWLGVPTLLIANYLPVIIRWYWSQKWLADFLIGQAGKSPPFRAVKMLALCAFLIGAVLDMVAS